MSNTIKLKRGSGSDPSANDLVVGELAIRTDQGKLFTKKDNGSVAEISGGSGVGLTDGDKGDITVSNGGDTFTIDNGVVTSAKIADGTIDTEDLGDLILTNAKVATNAAIAGSKISPSFTGNISSSTDGNTTISLLDTGHGFNASTIGISNGGRDLAITAPRDIRLKPSGGEDGIVLENNGTVELYHDGSKKFETTSSGVKFTGVLEAIDNQSILLGTSQDFRIRHTGSHSEITDEGTGNLRLGSNQTEIRTANLGTLSAKFVGAGAVELNHNGTKKFETSSTGVAVTGRVNATSGTNNQVLLNPSDGSIEISRSSAGAFIDFKSTTGEDHDARIQENNGGFDITGNVNIAAGLNVTGSINGTVSSANADILTLTANMGTNNGRALVFSAPDTDSGSQPFTIATGNALEVDIDNARTLFIDDSGQVNLHHDGSTTAKLSTSSTGVSVTGNITVTGTVDGVNIAERNTLFGGLTSSSGVLTNGVTATTQSAGNSTTRVATTAFVSTAISNLINGAPSALDTLNELAAAMSDDAAFSTTVTNSLATKMPLAGGQFTGNITFSGSQTVDGRDLSVDGSKLDGIESGATADQSASEILTLLKTVDGAGSGLDADTLDGISSASFLRSDAADTCSQPITFSGGIILPTSGEVIKFGPGDAANDDAHIEWLGTNNAGYLRISTSDDSDSSGSNEYIEIGDYAQQNRVGTFTQHLRISRDRFLVRTGSNSISQADRLNIDSSGTVDIYGNLDIGAGCDVTGNITVTGTVDGRDVASDGSKLDGIEAGATADQSASEILTLIKTVDGAGSGLDADTLDGISSASFLRSDQSDEFSGDLTIGNGTANTRLLIKKQDNNVADHIQFYNGTTRVGEIGVEDTTWLRINQETAKNIYTPRYIRADGGFFVDGNSKGINGSGNFVNGTIAGASDYGTLVRSNASDTLTGGTYTFNSSTDQKIILQGSNDPYIRFQEGTTNKAFVQWSSSGYLKIRNLEDGATLHLKDNFQFSPDNSTFYSVFHEGNLTVGDGGLTQNNFTDADHSKLNGIESGATADQTASEILTLIKTVDGAGSGLDADTLDGVSSGSFLRSDAVDSSSEDITINGLRVGEWTSSSYKGIFHSSQSGSEYMMISNDTHTYISATTGHNVYLRASANSSTNQLIVSTGGTTIGGNTVLTTASGLNASNINTGTINSARVPTLNQNTTGSSGSCTGNAATATQLANARTIAGVSFDGSANISLNNNAITNGAGYITGLSFDNLSGKESGTGDYSTSGDIVAGRGSGSIALTINDGKGNSNLTFNHQNGRPDQNGNAARIEVNTDSTSGATMYFELKSNVTSGANTTLTNILNLTETEIVAIKNFVPSSDSSINIGSNSVRFANGYFDTLYGDGSNLTGISAGATGGGSDEVFYENDQTVTTNYTITNGKNAMAAGPITINSGVTVTVGSGENLTIV